MRSFLSALLLSMLPVALAAPAAAADPPADPLLKAAHGGALARANRWRPWRPVGPGTRLPADTELMCEKGCTLLTPDGSTLVLDRDGQITVGQQMFVPLGGGPAALGRRFELREGNIAVSVSPDTRRPHTVIIGGPRNASAALRPGQSEVVASADRFGIACSTGSARVKMGSQILPLASGQATAITVKNTSLSAKPLGVGPRIKNAQAKVGELQPLAVALAGPGTSAARAARAGARNAKGLEGARPGFEWEPIEGASGYQIDIATDPHFRSLADVARVDGSTTRYLAKSLPAGTYFGRVIAFDEAGLASSPSQPTWLSVITLTVPVGSTAETERGAVIAPPGTTLQISDNESLEMAKEGEYFSAAPASVVVDANPHMLRLRRKADYGHETSLRIEPRGLRADIQLTPFWARWPYDTVEVSVTLRDPTGRIDPSQIDPDLEVLVGIEPIAIEWKREGACMTAHIDPRAATGPAVVRVIAKDHDGALLGRNFLEIEPVYTPPVPHRLPLANR